ncbi:MAG: tripartite tricarboxylate transporter substrate-binding protein [Pseudomonadota bacterium]
MARIVAQQVSTSFKLAGINVLHVPFKGSGPAIISLLGGEVDFLMEGLPALISSRSRTITSSHRHASRVRQTFCRTILRLE